jgi:hypothetical protein
MRSLSHAISCLLPLVPISTHAVVYVCEVNGQKVFQSTPCETAATTTGVYSTPRVRVTHSPEAYAPASTPPIPLIVPWPGTTISPREPFGNHGATAAARGGASRVPMICPDGTYHAPGDYCTICPDGTYTTAPQCTIAPNGKYVGDYGKGSSIAPDGTYVPAGPQTICPDGTYVGGTRCLIAPDGKYVGARD